MHPAGQEGARKGLVLAVFVCMLSEGVLTTWFNGQGFGLEVASSQRLHTVSAVLSLPALYDFGYNPRCAQLGSNLGPAPPPELGVPTHVTKSEH